ncbi:exodeoxyribonuclease III [Psychroflexus halocasei]|uniref:Exodeoxyribonuclease-3 n=1 Tax=Psychroflexus halocasei TaxID=908615 RepID=A0A1H4DHA7_9FLAO|nr:exodeoxyribonuclease III [Psychroflexus halocasei]SEA71820.1 exodeoxyribonuclease-3 [Psychroflexus halocasei]
MKIISYNVNGIRAALKKDFIPWLKATDADVVCFQETKAQPEQIDDSIFKEIGYEYCYWFSAEKKGYSSVGIISKIKPNHVEYGTGIPSMDKEGRNLRADFDTFSVMSLYLPSGTNDARLDFKLNYMDEFKTYIENLLQEKPNLVISGDYNICHEPIDIHDPVRLKRVSGFLPVEREWLTAFMEIGLIDSFRLLNPEKEQYSWWSYRGNARARNKGWRLDYHLVSEALHNHIERALILDEAVHSDHCPVLLQLK